MKSLSKADAQRLKALRVELKTLEAALAVANKREGNDPYVDVKVKKSQGRFERVRKKGVEDTAIGKYYLEVTLTAKQGDVYVPISLATGKKTAGFMYQIEGTAEGSLVETSIEVRGESISQISLGTLRYAKIPVGETALFRIQVVLRGKFGKAYQIVFTRINYKLDLTTHRYEQYLKPIHSDRVTFS